MGQTEQKVGFEHNKPGREGVGSFDRLLARLGGSRDGSPEGVYERAVDIVLRMVKFLEQEAFMFEPELEKMRNALRRARYGEVMDLAEGHYQKNYLQIKKLENEPPTLLEKILTQ